MTGLLLSLVGGLGVFYMYTALVLKWEGLQPGPAPQGSKARTSGSSIDDWFAQAGLEEVGAPQFIVAVGALGILGAGFGFAVFGSPLPAILLGAAAATVPVAGFRFQRARRLAKAHEAWPRMIEEIRILTSSAGRSVPQALFDVGRRAPEEMRGAFDAAHREWLLTTDFERTASVLKRRLADPTADVAVETLLVAHHLGGTDLERRLIDLAEDRILDTQGRKDASARQAGVRFARWFTVLVPMGMALMGMGIGNGREAYRTSGGQILVLFAMLLMLACWVWAGQIMKLPTEERVFTE